MINAPQFQRKGRAIASHLPGWRYDAINSYENVVKIIGPDKAKLNLYFDTWRKRLSVSGEFVSRYSRNTPSAGMDYKRRSEALAADIRRRVIADYLPKLAADRLLAREQREELERYKVFRAALFKYGHCEPYAHGSYAQNISEKRLEFRNWQARKEGLTNVDIFGTLYGDTVESIKLSELTPDQLFKILAIVYEKGADTDEN